MKIAPSLFAGFLLLLEPGLHAQTATQVWATRYNGPAGSGNADYAVATAVDSAGNVAVTGQSFSAGGQEDYYTAKYAAANGALLWEKRYNGAGNRLDAASNVALDTAGNVIVTGSSIGAGLTYNIYTAKYAAANGTLLWEKRSDSTANADAPGLGVDGAGNVVVAGSISNASGGIDLYTAKYAAANGALLWEKRYNGPGNGADFADSVVIDSAGNVVVTGLSTGVGGLEDYYTARYASSDGALLWEKRYGGTSTAFDHPYSVTVDSADNVVVTGESVNPGQDADYYTAKYAAADGALLWEKRYNGTGSNTDTAESVAVDSAGNVFVTGTSFGAGNSNFDSYTAKYAAANGALLWEKRYNGPASKDDQTRSVAVDAAGNAVVTGFSNNANLTYDYYTAKYAAADGHLLWEARYDGPAHNTDWMGLVFPTANFLALTADGGAVVTGQSSNGTNFDYATVRYAPPAGDADGDGLQDWWEQMWWGATAGHSALDDFDGDGIPELLEMGLGLNPKKPDHDAYPPAPVEGGYLTMSVTKHPGVTYQVQSAATPEASAFSATTTTVLADNATELKVRDNFLIATSPSRYLHVKVTAASGIPSPVRVASGANARVPMRNRR